MLSLLQALDAQFVKTYHEYTSLMDEYNGYAGQKITEEDLPDFNALLQAISQKFSECYPVINYINEQHQFASRAVFDYHAFIETLRKNGATIIEKSHDAQ